MPIPRVTIDSDKYHIYLKYYLKGEHYNPKISHTRSDSTKAEWILHQYHWEQRKIHEEPALIISRRFKTHYFVYEIQREYRNPDNEQEFLELECSDYIHYKEIWRCFYQPENMAKLDLNPPVEDLIEYTGNLFLFPYQTLEDLIRNNIIMGWRREEIVASINKMLKLNPEVFSEYERERVEHLRQLVKQNSVALSLTS